MLLLTLLLVLFTLLSISLEKAYFRVSARELKRRAREGDLVAASLYRAAGYGASLHLLLWLLIGTGAGGFFVLLAHSTSDLLAFLSSVAVVWFGFAWLPNSSASAISMRLAKWLAPILSWLLNRLHPLLNGIARIIRRFRPLHVHSGVYRKEDVLELLQRQADQADNRMTKQEIDIATHALKFSDQIVRDVMIPRRAVKLVNASDTLGPVLINELHESGHSRFPVYEDKKDNIVGTLFLRDLVGLKAQGMVKEAMHKKAMYIHEEQSLYDVLQATLKTHHHLFMVVNSFEEFVGIIALEDVIEQIIGKPIVDEFDRYEDIRAVAARTAVEEHKEHEEQEKQAEVVE